MDRPIERGEWGPCFKLHITAIIRYDRYRYDEEVCAYEQCHINAIKTGPRNKQYLMELVKG